MNNISYGIFRFRFISKVYYIVFERRIFVFISNNNSNLQSPMIKMNETKIKLIRMFGVLQLSELFMFI